MMQRLVKLLRYSLGGANNVTSVVATNVFLALPRNSTAEGELQYGEILFIPRSSRREVYPFFQEDPASELHP
jgi:hypothetical protein